MKPGYAALILPILAACAPAAEKQPPAPTTPEVEFHATEYAFAGPDTVAPGWTTIKFMDDGNLAHHMIMAQLDEGKTSQDLITYFQEHPNSDPEWVKWRGGANEVEPGASNTSMVNLTPGRYLTICFIPDSAGVPHMAKGMMKEFVVAGEQGNAPAPTADGEIRTHEFGFTLPDIAAGTHTLRFVNDGKQIHEVQVMRLNEGATMEQFMAGMAPGAATPPPATMVGGPGALSPGLEDYWTLTLEPGKYVLLCFVPDSDGVPHFAKGMVQEWTIPAAS